MKFDSCFQRRENSIGDPSLSMLKMHWFWTGEPLVDGIVTPYDEKYHADWVLDENHTTVKS